MTTYFRLLRLRKNYRRTLIHDALVHSFCGMAKIRKELSTDCKDLIVKAYQNIKNIRKLAQIFKIPKSTICDILKRFRERGDIENRPRTGRPSHFTKRDESSLLKIMK